MAPLVRTGGSRHTGLAALPHRNIQRRTFEHDNYNMSGYVIFLDGNKKYFTIDSADAPYLFDSSRLEKSDVYFKMQCPIDLDNEGF